MNQIATAPGLKLSDHAANRWAERWAEITGLDLDDEALGLLMERVLLARNITGAPIDIIKESLALGAVMVRRLVVPREMWAVRVGERWIYFVLERQRIITVLPKQGYKPSPAQTAGPRARRASDRTPLSDQDFESKT